MPKMAAAKKTDLQVDLAPGCKRSLVLRNPVMTASGTFSNGIEFARVFDLGRLGAVDNPLEILAGCGQRDAAQAVIDPELDHQEVNALLQHPIDPAQTSGAGLSAQSGVDHPERKAFSLDLLLDQGGKAFVRAHAKTSRETVAEEEDGSARIHLQPGRFGGADERPRQRSAKD